MNSTTYEELTKRINDDTEKIQQFSLVFNLSLSYFELLAHLIATYYRSISVLYRLNSLEKACAICAKEECEIFESYKIKFKNIAKGMRKIREGMIEIGFPKFSVNYLLTLAEKFDDKAETYSLSFDKETRNLLYNLKSKMESK